MGEALHLAEHVLTVNFEDIPADAIEHAKRSIRDYVGLCIYGINHPIGQQMTGYVGTLTESTDVTIIGHGKSNMPNAALVNGITGHAADYDDTFESVVIHPSCTAFPAAFAAAEMKGDSGADLLTGYIVGLDVLLRIGHSVAPSHWHHGWHSTATVGVFGAAAAAGSILNLTRSELRQAFGIAGSCSSGMKKNSGTMTNPFHCGHAAQMGVSAALLAQNGFTADDEIFSGQYGYGEMMTPGGDYTPESISDPDIEWAVLDNGFKPYPSGVVTHAAMEGLRTIVNREKLEPSDITSITAEVDERVTDTIDESDPQNAQEARGSYEFCLAAILREGDAGINEFDDEYVNNPQTRNQMEKINIEPTTELFTSGSAEASYGSRVTVECTNGTKHTESVSTAPGSPSNPLSEPRLRSKFFECAETGLSKEQAKQLEETIPN